MRVLILSDGVPGHDRASLGILAALAKHREVEARVLPVREIRRLSRRAKRLLAGLLPFESFWSAFYEIADAGSVNSLPVTPSIPTGDVDLVVSTGPRTAAANIALARRLHAKNVYFGLSRWPSDRFFTLLLTPERLPPLSNRAFALPPSDFDSDQLPSPRPLAANGTERQAALLFGGQSKHYSYTAADMELLAEQLSSLTRDLPWLKWTVFDSRRSPPEFEHLVDSVRTGGAPIEFVRFAEQGLASNARAFRSDLVLVTADSMSMLAESIASCRPTGVLFADRYKPPQRDAIEHQAMIADRRAFPMRFSGLTADALLNGAESVETLRGSQLDALYKTIARHGI